MSDCLIGEIIGKFPFQSHLILVDLWQQQTGFRALAFQKSVRGNFSYLFLNAIRRSDS
jgi:hypothetical protein